MEEIFTEVYRPKEFKDVVGLDQEIPKLIEDGNIPHLLFIGSAGTGKTTTAKIIIKKLGADCLSFNASKDGGIDVIRDKIEPFATKKSDKIKIVFLDEFDNTTPKFQTALRNFMETHARTTRFIATCNYPNKIIDPLISRFSKFKFNGYKEEGKIEYIKKVVEKEGIKIDDETITLLCKKSRDDIRGMLNFLNKNKYKEIVKEDIVNNNLALNILQMLHNKKWFELRQELLKESLDYEYVLEQIENIVFNNPKLSVEIKQRLNKIITDGMFQMHFSFNKEICFSSVLYQVESNLF
jgi:DNA polymerase III delta prime subunit